MIRRLLFSMTLLVVTIPLGPSTLPVLPPTEGETVANRTPATAYVDPIAVNTVMWSEAAPVVQAGHHPLIARAMVLGSNQAAYTRAISELASIRAASKTLAFSSWRTLQDSLSTPGHSDRLKSIGVRTIAYNPEAHHTPQVELQQLQNPDPAQNSVAIFARTARAHGFTVQWVPLRLVTDSISDQALKGILEAGVNQIGLQEQKFIENQCVAARAEAVQATVERYRALAGSRPLRVDVQLMPGRCLNGDAYAVASCGLHQTYAFQHCDQFVDRIAPLIDSVSIWASQPADVAQTLDLLQTLRAGYPTSPSPVHAP